MTNIIQQPSTYNFAGNIADIVLTGESSVTFSIPLLLEEVYYPDADGRITIPLRAFFEAHLHAAGVDEIPDEGSPLTAYTYYINGAEAGNFYVFPGGVAAQSIDTPLFLKSNFLTWQPQTRQVSYHEPQWLRYVAIHVCTAKVKGYFASGDPVTVTLKEMTAGRLYCLDMNYGRIRGLFEEQPVYYDVWVESDDGRLSFVQRYVLREEDSDSADYFVFENSLGGYDTIRFTGDRKEVGESESRNAIFDGETFEYGIDYGKSWTKYTGYLPNERIRTWVLEFFSSCRRYHLADSSLERIYVSKPKLESTAGEASGYEFSFAYTHQSRYLNIARDELPEQLEIVGPGAELFFLAPRLNEFPLLDIEQDILIPAQYPYTEKWGVLSLAALLAIVQSDNSGSIGTIYHDQLKNLDLANQHPIKAISGLQTALEQKVSLFVYNTFVSTYNNHVNSPSHLNAEQQSILSRFSVVDGRLQIEGDVYTTGLLSQLGSGEAGEDDFGSLSLGSLSNVGAWADTVGDEDVLLFRPKGSSVWGMKRLSEIMAGGGGGGTVYHDQLEHLDYPDQHPIAAIAGLQSALNAKADANALSGYLPLSGGTISSDLKIDRRLGIEGGVGVDYSGAYMQITVGLEHRGLLYLTQDGVLYEDKAHQRHTMWHSGNLKVGDFLGFTGDANSSSLLSSKVNGYGYAYQGSGSPANGSYLSFGYNVAGGYTQAQLLMTLSSNPELYLRYSYGENQWSEWRRTWHSGNSNLSTVDWNGRDIKADRSLICKGGYGLRLSHDAPDAFGRPYFGIFLENKANLSGFGTVQGDWNVFFTTSSFPDTEAGHRGWIFRNTRAGQEANVASIDADGNMTLKNLISNGSIFAYTSLHNISADDAMKYAGRPGYYNSAFGWKNPGNGASILLYRPDESKQIPIVFCTGSGDHAAVSVEANSNDLLIMNNKGTINLRTATVVVEGNIVVRGTITQLGG